MTDFYGDSYRWGIGVVEDVNDPERASRVRVRVHGLHSDDPVVLPTSDLPWSQVLLPVTSAGLSGIGTTPHGLKPGSQVWCSFMDGDSKQTILVTGSIPGRSPQTPIQVAEQDSPLALRGSSRPEQVFNFFVARGYSEEQAAGILGSMVHQVGVELDPSEQRITGFGILDLSDSHKEGLIAYAEREGLDPKGLRAQLEYADVVLQAVSWPNRVTSSGTATGIVDTGSPAKASDGFTQVVYVGDTERGKDQRHALARQAMSTYGSGGGSEAGSVFAPRAAAEPGVLGTYVETADHLFSILAACRRDIRSTIVHHADTYEGPGSRRVRYRLLAPGPRVLSRDRVPLPDQA